VNIVGLPSAIIVREDTAGVIVNLTVSLSEVQSVDVHIPISQIAGDATLGDDYKLSTEELIFPAFDNTPQSVVLTILDDDIAEADETIKIQVGDDKVANATISPKTFDVTITNSTALELELSFAWAKDYLFHYWSTAGNPTPRDTTINTKNAVDFDFYMFDSLGSAGGNEIIIQTPANSAQTGASPEFYTFTAPDDTGVYVIAANLYDNIFRQIGYGPNLAPQGNFPITTSFFRKGVIDAQIVQDDALAYNPDSPDLQTDGDVSSFQDLFKLVVKSDMYIIYKTDGSLFANGRVKAPKYKIKTLDLSLPAFKK
jgi:hypothetical protein